MKTKIVLLLCLTMLVFSGNRVTAQKSSPRDPMNVGTWLLNVGIGPGVNFYSYNSGFGFGLQAAAERGMWQAGPGVITLGPEVGVSFFSYSGASNYYQNYSYKYNWTSVIIAARSAFHYGWEVKGLDTYGGLSMGLRFLSFSRTYNGDHNLNPDNYNPGATFFHFGPFVGASYFFNNSIGINGELGYNTSWIQAGLVFKLN